MHFSTPKSNAFTRVFLFFFVSLVFLLKLSAQSFDQSELDMNGFDDLNGVTSLMYGPDGRLYVAEWPGLIKILTIQRNSSTDYVVTGVEELDGIQTMEDHNDDGSTHNSVARETTGLTVAGTAQNPVIYVSSSDFRIGAGPGGGNGDIGLDTNSGVITRFSWNGASWDVVDLVRGLPRSEENHATNGLEFVTINGNDYLIVASGGITNGGAPSTNFVYTCEYALSAAVLSVDLTALNGLPILDDNGRSYIYDLPTLDDPTRDNVNGITDPDVGGYDGVDVNDPWGGNDGLNQAMIVPGGPVQIFSPGYRNAYDLVVTESGGVYVTDNGANGGWGGFPVNEGMSGTVTNDYDPAEPGSSSSSGGEEINNEDHLQLVTTDIQNYAFGSLYGGHPNPTRANPTGAGLYTDDGTNQVFRTLIYDPSNPGPGYTDDPSIALPANWPPVSVANIVEGDWRGPGISNPDGPDDDPVTIWETNTNGIDEYTASNFGGAMQGNLIAGRSTGGGAGGWLHRVELNDNGTLDVFTEDFFSGLGGNPLGVTCNGDGEIFPGTIWAGTFNAKIVVFEPVDFVFCIDPLDPTYDEFADYDGDGYTNQDEEDNGTDPCNGGSQPSDFDKSSGGTLISDLNDTDDDFDGIPDGQDPFQLGDHTQAGSDAFSLPISNALFNDQQGLGGIFGLGMTGLMNNGDTGNNWLDWLDDRGNGPNPDDVLGGAPGIMTSHMTSGTANGVTNTQEKGYQYGVQVDNTTGVFTVTGGMNGFTGPLRLYGNAAAVGGELGFFIGDGTQSNFIKFVVTTDGFTALQEINDVPQASINFVLPIVDRPSAGIEFHFVVDPATGNVDLEYQIDGGTRLQLGSITAQGSILTALQDPTVDLAVGFIGTSGTLGVELEGSWDFLNVIGENPTLTAQLPDLIKFVGDPDDIIDLDNYFEDNGGVANLTYTVEFNTDSSISASIIDNILTLSYPINPANSDITIRATDDDLNIVEQTFNVLVDIPLVLYRVNSGGPEIAAIDGGIVWEEDTTSNTSQFLLEAGTNSAIASSMNSYSGSIDQSTTPLGIFSTERFDGAPLSPNMTYSFPVPEPGNYLVRLYLGNSFEDTSETGQRIFDVELENNPYPELSSIDLSDTYGHKVGTVIDELIVVSDDNLDIEFFHDVENPLINGIEIIKIGAISKPQILVQLPNINRPLNSNDDIIDLDSYFTDDSGVADLEYTIETITDPLVNASIIDNLLTLSYPNAEVVSQITIRATDLDAQFIDQSFTVTVTDETIVIHRVNAGGDEVLAIDNDLNWEEDTNTNSSTYLVEPGTNNVGAASMNSYIGSIDQTTTPIDIFSTERFDGTLGNPNLQYVFPVPITGVYEVRLFMGNSFNGTAGIGDRVFDVQLESTIYPELTGIDLSGTFGHKVGAVIEQTVEVLDGDLNIEFLHVLDADNPLLNGIEIVKVGAVPEVALQLPNLNRALDSPNEDIDLDNYFSDDQGVENLIYSIPNNAELTIGTTIVDNILTLDFPAIDALEDIVVRATDTDLNFVEQTFSVKVTDEAIVLYRVNSGGSSIAAIDGDLDWAGDLDASGSTFLLEQASNSIGASSMNGFDTSVDLAITPADIFSTERFDVDSGVPNLEYEFLVPESGKYIVRLFMGNSFTETSGVGERIFNIQLEEISLPSLTDIDLSGTFGHKTGVMIEEVIDVTDGAINVELIHGSIENPLINGIEILKVGAIPIVSQQLADITRPYSSPDDQIDLNNYFDDDNGVADLEYTVETITDPSVAAVIVDNVLTISYPAIDAVSQITIRATDAELNFVEQSFTVTVNDELQILYRVNAGGEEVTAIDGFINWAADTDINPSSELVEAASNSVGGFTTANYDTSIDTNSIPLSIFNTERFDTDLGEPNVQYSFPVTETGNYNVRLFFANGFPGTSEAGERIFDVELEGFAYPDFTDIDLSGTYGHSTGVMIEQVLHINADNNFIDIELLHGSIQNPLLNGIEIIKVLNPDPTIFVEEIADQINAPGEALDGSLGVVAFGGIGNLQFSATGLPDGVGIEPTNGQIGGTISEQAEFQSPYSVTITIDDSDGSTANAEVITFEWVVSHSWTDKDEDENYTARHECSFVQAGDKFYLMGGRENSASIDVYDYATDSWVELTDSTPTVNGTQLEFNHFQAIEYQGFVWVIGAFNSNEFPNETPAEYIWIFDPANSEWIQGPEIPVDRRRGSAGLVLHNDKFYVLGGNTDGHDGGYVDWFDEYDPATGIWTSLGNMPRARDHFQAVVINNQLYAAGGRLTGGPGGTLKPVIAEVDVYNFATESWDTLPSDQNLPTPRAGVAAVNYEDKLVVIGGEVEDENVYGTLTSDALAITERYDPNTMEWSRLPDMNHKRHGFQAIVSGSGIFVTAGSSALGGEEQKNMEYYEDDAPVGSPSMASSLSVLDTVLIADGATENISLDVISGNTGIFIKSMEITGANASDFSIGLDPSENILLNQNSSTVLPISLSGTGEDRIAILTINYGADSSIDILLTNTEDIPLPVTNPGNQFNYDGDTVNLQVDATSVNSLTYSATGLPPNLEIDPNTGLITGILADGSGSSGTSFLEDNGLVIIEAESGDIVSDWTLTNADGEIGIIAGSDHATNQNGGTISYEINITNTGVYRFNWNSFFSGLSSKDENDNWLRFPNNDDVWFFGQDGGPTSEAAIIANLQGAQDNIVFPKGSSRVSFNTTPVGNGGNGYFKIYRSSGTTETYKWQAATSDNDGHDIYVWFVNPGVYKMEISERSAGHAIDRVALYKVDGTNYSDVQLSAFPESQTGPGGVSAAENSPYQVEVTVVDNTVPPKLETVEFTWFVAKDEDLISVPQADVINGDAELLVNFTGSNSVDDVGVTSYFWDFKDGTTSSDADPTHTFLQPGVYNVELTVEDADSNSSTNSITITVTGEAPVAVASATPLIGALPLEVSFTGSTSTDDIGVVNYAWDFKDGNISNEPDPTHTFSTAGIYEVELVVYDQGGLSDTTTVTITVGQSPVANITANPESGDVPLEVSFTGSSSTDDGTIISYAWDFKDGITSTETDPVHTFMTTGIYEVELTVTDDTGLTDMQSVTITVNEPTMENPPVAIATANPTEGSAPLPVIFDASNSTDNVEIVGYSWDFDNGTTSTEINPVTVFTMVGTYNVTLEVTDNEGQTDSTTITITVNEPIDNESPVAVATADVQSGDAPLEVSFTGSNSTDDEGIVSYEWDFGNGDTSDVQDPQYTFSQIGMYTVTLTVTDAGGLADSEAIEITVNQPVGNESPVAVATADVQSGDAPLEVSFTGSNSTDDEEIVSYEWDFGNGDTSEVQDPQYTFSQVGMYTVTLTVTDAGGLADSETIEITVNQPVGNESPVAVATADVQSGDAPLEVSFTGSNSTDDVGIVSYEWDFGNGDTSEVQNPQYTFSQVGMYTVTLTVTDAGGLADSETIEITVNEPIDNQAPVAVVSSDVQSGDAPLEVSFTGSGSSDNVGIVSYEWNFGDGTTSSDINPVHIFEFGGTFEVILTVTDGQGLTDSSSIDIEVEENSVLKVGDPEAVIAPNPAFDFARISLVSLPQGVNVSKISLHDSSGRLLGIYEPDDIFVDNEYVVPVHTLRDELYYVRIEVSIGDPIVLRLLVRN